MPEPLDRKRWLANVAARLDLPEHIAVDVLDELIGHLDDAAASLGEAGYAADDAERRAIHDLGDPGALGRELSRARHERRRLLAAVGGGLRVVIVEGVRVYLAILIAILVAALGAFPLVAFVMIATGRSMSGAFSGPLASLGTTLLVATAFAYLGWILPARVSVFAGRSVRGVRAGVALAGLVGGSAVLWLVPNISLDHVLAAGLPLAPIAFAVSALRAPTRPTVRAGMMSGIVLGFALVLPMTALGLVTTHVNGGSNWYADESAIGAEPGDVGLQASDVTVEWGQRPGSSFAWPSFATSAEDMAARFPTMQVEVWPAVVRDGVIRFGPAPLAVSAMPTTPGMEIAWTMPSLRDPVTTFRFVVGLTPAGRRVVLETQLDLQPTTPWTGTLAAWWFGP